MTQLTIRTAQAAILVRSREPLEIAQIELPAQLTYGQVLVKIHFSGICGSQIGEIDAAKGPDRFLPHMLGHEASATILAIGEGVSTVSQGDAVVLHWRPGSGLESPTPQYRWEGRPVNAGFVTTFNSHAVVSENRVTRIPDSFDKRLAPLLGCAVTTGFGAVVNDANLKIGQSVVVFGVGGVGGAAIKAASLTTAFPIVAVDLNAEKLNLACHLGATHAVDATDEEMTQHVRAIVGDRGADVVIDTTGIPTVIEEAYELTGPTGRTVLVGVPKNGMKASFYTLPLHFGKTLIGSHGGESQPAIDIPRYVRLVEAGLLDLNAFPVIEYALEDLNQAIADLRVGVVGRQVVRMPGPSIT